MCCPTSVCGLMGGVSGTSGHGVLEALKESLRGLNLSSGTKSPSQGNPYSISKGIIQGSPADERGLGIPIPSMPGPSESTLENTNNRKVVRFPSNNTRTSLARPCFCNPQIIDLGLGIMSLSGMSLHELCKKILAQSGQAEHRGPSCIKQWRSVMIGKILSAREFHNGDTH